MRFKIPIIIFLLISLISCQGIIDNYYENKDTDNYVSPFSGTYIGTYSGEDNGTLNIEVSKKDGVTITKHSNISNADESYFDILTGNSLNANASPTTGFRLFGNLSSQTKIYSGTWKQGNWTGTWTITKQ